jgi:hypothetical protein
MNISAKVAAALLIGVSIAGSAAQAATYTTVDLSPYVNEGFTNSWFINGSDFAPLGGTTSAGNQGSTIPFAIANPSDGNGGVNNFWFGLYGGPGTLFGPKGSVTIPVAVSGVNTVYTLADNTFGTYNNTEFSVTFTGTGGSITGLYVGGDNTKDYNLNYSTTGGLITPNAQYWFANGNGQWLQDVQWTLPAGFGLTSITFNQVDGSNGAILAGVTLGGAVPEMSTWAMMLAGFAALGFVGYRRSKKVATALAP